ncbi:YeeE/YedE thiosulfate transporter family protein [Hathewaya histolytica]|uniref:YeeE/YedE thiosulfate transporter family protein n=1 Tax=Hathewaya histolytica TaxID=1498 RepID=UPI003B680F5A
MESTKTVERKKIKRKNQMPYGIALIVIIFIIGYSLNGIGPKHTMSWMLGILLGFTLQKSRFCFTASLRDPLLTGGTSLSKAVITTISIASVGFAAIQYKAFLGGKAIPGNISPSGVHIAIGAFMFGIGMVIAGGCASGTLMRVGEGFTMQWLVLIFFVIGSLWGVKDLGFWKKMFINKDFAIFMPNVVGWIPALVVQFGLLFGLYILVDWFGNKSN